MAFRVTTWLQCNCFKGQCYSSIRTTTHHNDQFNHDLHETIFVNCLSCNFVHVAMYLSLFREENIKVSSYEAPMRKDFRIAKEHWKKYLRNCFISAWKSNAFSVLLRCILGVSWAMSTRRHGLIKSKLHKKTIKVEFAKVQALIVQPPLPNYRESYSIEHPSLMSPSLLSQTFKEAPVNSNCRAKQC